MIDDWEKIRSLRDEASGLEVRIINLRHAIRTVANLIDEQWATDLLLLAIADDEALGRNWKHDKRTLEGSR